VAAALLLALTLVVSARAQAAPAPAPAPGPGTASAGPLAHPARDVDVTYRIADGRRVIVERMRWLAAARRQRLDPAGAGLFVLIDFNAHTMQTVRLAERAVLDVAAPEVADAPYTREGEDSVAGLACTDWEATATDGRPTVACITDDGVTLRASVAGRTLLTAVSVDYAPQDPALFVAPSGFTVQRPDGAAGSRP
jgi:hypothetical protein